MALDLPALDATSRTWLPLDDARRLIVDTYPGIVLGIDPDGRIAWVNPAAEQRLGYAAGELAGQPFVGTLVDQQALEESSSWPAGAPGQPALAGVNALALHLAPSGSGAAAEAQAWLLHDKAGMLRPTRLAVGALRDGHGEATGLVAVEPWPRAESDLQPQLVHHDNLTGLATRAVLPDRAEMALQRAARQKTVVALLLIELTGFEAVCREHGRSVGDDLLRATAGRLYFELRKTDTAVRLDEGRFAALLVDLHAADEARQVALKIRRALSAPANVGVGRLAVDARVGIACYPGQGDQLLPLLEAAESALAVAREGDAQAGGVATAGEPGTESAGAGRTK